MSNQKDGKSRSPNCLKKTETNTTLRWLLITKSEVPRAIQMAKKRKEGAPMK